MGRRTLEDIEGPEAGADLRNISRTMLRDQTYASLKKAILTGKIVQGDFAPGFMAELMYKDLGIAMNLARENGVPVLMGALAHQMFSQVNAAGLGKKDFSIVIKMFEDLLNVKLKF